MRYFAVIGVPADGPAPLGPEPYAGIATKFLPLVYTEPTFEL